MLQPEWSAKSKDARLARYTTVSGAISLLLLLTFTYQAVTSIKVGIVFGNFNMVRDAQQQPGVNVHGCPGTQVLTEVLTYSAVLVLGRHDKCWKEPVDRPLTSFSAHLDKLQLHVIS